eukprot:TRINITY_DN2063_c0_g1_i1.p1 TRINITY_DN2063_c0_g1~~TRINITY_DN2063_c0_g1_i1.p1  ORF type:complete len:836 (-),score=264.67 TRINITY_DN2063_c0_g1_i1:162-2669(-)
MGNAAMESNLTQTLNTADAGELEKILAALPEASKVKLRAGLDAVEAGGKLNIVLHEDLTMRGGAQIWLADCGKRLAEKGHTITFILPEDSLIKSDVEAYSKVVTYTHEKSAADPDSYQAAFTEVLKPANVCVTLVRQVRGNYQNVRFIAKCIKDAGLNTFLISKTGTFDPTYKAEFYGGCLLDSTPQQCCTVTIAEFTRQAIIDEFKIKPALIQTIYNGTDTEKFKRTPEMAVEAKKRYPIPEGRFVVGSIGRFVAVKGQKVLLKAVKKLIDSGRVPNIHVLMVGEGDLKDDIEKMVKDENLTDHVSIYPFTKEPFYVFEACDCIALASFLEGLPNALLEALAMEKPCIASRIYGMPEVVVDGKTGFCFEAGDVKDEATWDKMADGCADALAKIAELDAAGRKKMADNGKALVFDGHDKVKCFQRILDLIQQRAKEAKAAQLKAEALNIVLHEDLTMRGGAQIWLADCGKRLSEAGHNITFLLPEDSLIVSDVQGYAKVVTYTHEKSAADPHSYQALFTEVLKPAQVCVTLVRQIRGKYQNVSFIAKCIADAGLKTFLISKTGTFDPTYKPEFYGGVLLNTSPPQCCTVTIAEFTRQSIIDEFKIKPEFVQTIYNGTDTAKFKRTPEMAVEAKKRYPIADGKFVVGSIGRFVAVKGQKVLLMAAKKLIESGKVPNIHILMVGEGELKAEIESMVTDLGLSDAVSIHPFTKEPFYVFEACDCIALASFLEGLPNALLEALAMEKPCVASRIYGMPEVVIDGKTGYCFEAGDLKDEATWDKMAEGCAEAIAKIAALGVAGRRAMADNGKALVFDGHDKAKCFQSILDLIQDKAREAK